MTTTKPSKQVLRNLAKPFKNDKFNLLERMRDALRGMKLFAFGDTSAIVPEERPDLLKDYYDTDLDLAKPQLITLANDCVYIVRTVQAENMGKSSEKSNHIFWHSTVLYKVFSTVCTPGNRECPPDYDDVQHYTGESEIEALMAAIKVVLLDRYDAWCEVQGELEREKNEKLAAKYFGGKK